MYIMCTLYTILVIYILIVTYMPSILSSLLMLLSSAKYNNTIIGTIVSFLTAIYNIYTHTHVTAASFYYAYQQWQYYSSAYNGINLSANACHISISIYALLLVFRHRFDDAAGLDLGCEIEVWIPINPVV